MAGGALGPGGLGGVALGPSEPQGFFLPGPFFHGPSGPGIQAARGRGLYDLGLIIL